MSGYLQRRKKNDISRFHFAEHRRHFAANIRFLNVTLSNYVIGRKTKLWLKPVFFKKILAVCQISASGTSDVFSQKVG